MVERVGDALNSVKKAINGSRVHLIGIAYKKDVNDMRESPALPVIEQLRERGADVAQRARRFDREVLEEGKTADYVAEYSGPDGAPVFWHHLKFPFPGPNGQRMLGMISLDATRERLLERQNAESSARRAIVVEAANIGSWDWDLATDRVAYSSKWKQQIGYGEDEIADTLDEWRSRVHPDDFQATWEAAERCVQGKSAIYDVEFRFRHKNGSYRWIHCVGTIIKHDGSGPGSFMGTHIDITSRKTAELSLRAALALRPVTDMEAVIRRQRETGEAITVRRGPYGVYAQQGEQVEGAKTKPRRASLPKGVDGDSISQAAAVESLTGTFPADCPRSSPRRQARRPRRPRRDPGLVRHRRRPADLDPRRDVRHREGGEREDRRRREHHTHRDESAPRLRPGDVAEESLSGETKDVGHGVHSGAGS